MIKIITTSLLVILFLLSGKIIQGLKKLIGLIISNFMRLLSFFGIKIKSKEKDIKISQEFKETYKDIKIMKLSNKNIKDESSIDWVWLSVFIVAGLLVLLNMKFIWGTNPISNWLYSIIKNLKLVKNETDMNTLYTATFFSILSFSASKILQRWKETKQNRIERKQEKIKLRAVEIMSTKELLDEAKKKDEQAKKDLQ